MGFNLGFKGLSKNWLREPIPMAVGSKVWISDCLLARIEGLNAARGVVVCLLCVSCVVR